MTVQIRVLNREDAAAYQQVRLRALQEHPEAFGSGYEDEAGFSLELVADRLTASLPHLFTFGAFEDDKLVGTLFFGREVRVKQRHRARLAAMYVAPEARRLGAGRALLTAAIEYARSLPEIRQITLSVTSGNYAARRLYRSVGFVTWGIEPEYIRVGDTFYDMESMVLLLS